MIKGNNSTDLTESENEASVDECACSNGDVDPDATLPYVDLDATLRDADGQIG